ncbi:MAG: serine/threonine-protein phosphatase, partial [Treponemataceae bacterium]|nr:serine/threonine-protein phosphatase [Treponemataceae bacterium]
VLICYTDGLTEALNTNLEQFGAERVKQLVKENSVLSANELLKCIMKTHTAFTKGKQHEDDITLVIAKRTNTADFVSEETDEDSEKEDLTQLFPVADETGDVNGGGWIL